MKILRRNFKHFLHTLQDNEQWIPGRQYLGIDIGNGGLKVILAQIESDGTVCFEYLTFNGHHTIPSVISFPGDLDQPVIGVDALNSALMGQGEIFRIGKDSLDNNPVVYALGDDGKDDKSMVDALGDDGKDDKPLVYALGDDGREYTSGETLQAFLQQAFIKIDEALGVPARSLPAFVSYPANFSARQRDILMDTLRVLGMEILDEGEEPVQASLSFVSELPIPNTMNFMVIDLGAGTSDLAIACYDPIRGEVTVRSTLAISAAGIDFDNGLTQMITKRCFPGQKIDNSVLLSEINAQAIGAKNELTDRDDALVTLAFEGSADCLITRSEFDQASEDLYDKIRMAIRQALKESHVEIHDIKMIFLTGGTSRIPAIQRNVQSMFPGAEIYMSDHCELDVALGNAMAAVKAARQQNRIHGVVPALPMPEVHSVLSYDLCIRVRCGNPYSYRIINSLLIPRNTPIPTAIKLEQFAVFQPNQTNVNIILTAAPPESDFKERQIIAREELTLNPQADNSKPQVEISAEVTEKGRARIRARDLYGTEQVEIETDVAIGTQPM
jgi:molecular chaperone DnaK